MAQLYPRILVLSFTLLHSALGMSATQNVGKNPQTLIQRALQAVGLEQVRGKVLHFQAQDAVLQPMQSDRTYPPYYALMQTHEIWFDPAANVQRTATQYTFFGSGPSPARTTLVEPAAAFAVQDTLLRPFGATLDKLNVWAVLLDWAKSEKIRWEKQTVYRDYPREVLVRTTGQGEERLWLDPKSGFPVKLDFQERHFLWGQVQVEYVYSTWIQVENVFLPAGAFRQVDGETEIYRTIGQSELIALAQAPRLTLPASSGKQPPAPTPGVLASPPPDTVRISANTFLIKNVRYTETVTFIDGTVYLLDATLGEERARQDAAWIEKLFPGQHPVVVVVTDLAWPHIAGVRYWVARGATMVSHRMSETFLKRVIEHKWTPAPDLLEQTRTKTQFKFVKVDSALALANGRLQLYAIDGISSEGAVMAFLPNERFLWAGDYIQTNTEPSAYATEVWKAAKRVGIAPERTAAQHLPVTPWRQIEALQQ